MSDGGSVDSTVFRHVRVVDADGARPDQRVLVSGDRIISVSPDDTTPVGPGEIDGTGASLVPGLWDSHVHLEAMGNLGGVSGPGDNYLLEHLRGHIYSGVTTVVDTGANREVIAATRARVSAGELWSPRVKVVGPVLTVPGGHGCAGGYDPWFCELIIGPGSASDAVANAASIAPDLIKVIVEAGIPINPQPRITPAELMAVTDATLTAGFGVIAHVSSAADAADAISAGVDALAHLPIEDELDPILVSDIAASGTAVISTLSLPDAWGRMVDDPGFLATAPYAEAVPAETLAQLSDAGFQSLLAMAPWDEVVTRTRGYTADAKTNVANLHAEGVAIIAGTDAGNPFVLHGPSMVRELELMVDAGLTPVEAIAAATLEPARLFGEEDERGRVAPGQIADLLLVDGDPSTDVTALAAVRDVYLAGVRVPRESLTAAGDLDDLVRIPRTLSAGELCLNDSECGTDLACEPDFRMCRLICEPLIPGSCPSGYGCFDTSPAPIPPGYCFPGEGCDVAAQDCPAPGVYGHSCVEAGGATYCM